MLYVPKKNQHLIRSTLPTSHGFEPFPREGQEKLFNPLLTAPTSKSKFVMMFDWVGTMDVSPYLCIKEGLQFRREVCGGEDKIMDYCTNLSRDAVRTAAQFLKTEVMENKEGTLTDCFMSNLGLPLQIGEGKGEIPVSETVAVAIWMTARLSEEFDLYSPVYIHAGKFWTRWSGQIYLEPKDFEFGAKALKTLCERAKTGEYK